MGSNMTKYTHVCLGGTFDHLHKGHIRMLDFAFQIGDHVSIGISTAELTAQKNYSESIEPYQIRLDGVQTYLAKHKLEARSTIFPLKTIYGIADTSRDIEAIVVTRESKPNAHKINAKRKENGLRPLVIEVVPFYKGPDNKIVRSERIRGGAINRRGELYLSALDKSRVLRLPPPLRELLRKPLGTIVKGDELSANTTARKSIQVIKQLNPTKSILVGDIVVRSLNAAQYFGDLQIIDNRSRRKDLEKNHIIKTHKVSNPAGLIRHEAILKIKQLLETESSDPQTLEVDGEEDLLALPAILLAPLDSVVVYGQFDMGIIVTQVTESKKEQVADILRQFE